MSMSSSMLIFHHLANLKFKNKIGCSLLRIVDVTSCIFNVFLRSPVYHIHILKVVPHVVRVHQKVEAQLIAEHW